MKIWRRALVVAAVPTLLALVCVSPAGATAFGAGAATGQSTALLGGGPDPYYTEIMQLSLVGDISAGSNFVGTASTSTSFEVVGCTSVLSVECPASGFGTAPIDGSGATGSIHGTCGDPGSTGTVGITDYELHLVCSVSIAGGPSQVVALNIVLADAGGVAIGSVPTPALVGVFAG